MKSTQPACWAAACALMLMALAGFGYSVHASGLQDLREHSLDLVNSAREQEGLIPWPDETLIQSAEAHAEDMLSGIISPMSRPKART